MANFSFNPLAWAIKPLYEKAKAEDSLFADVVKEKESRTEKPKSLEECAEYILGEAFHWAEEHQDVNGVGYAGLPDDEMVNLIKHYYDEDDITIRKAEAEVKVTHSAPSNVIPFKPKNLADLAYANKKKEEPKKGETLDLFAGMFGDEDEKEEQKPIADKAKVEQGVADICNVFDNLDKEVEEEESAPVLADDDDLPL